MTCTLLTFACIIVLLLVISINTHETYVNSAKKTVDIVIARYNEDLDWLCEDSVMNTITNSSLKTSIYIYNKGINNVTPKFMECYGTIVDLYIIQLPNVGRCDHTYLHHIVKNYHNLADVTVFLPASCDMDFKYEKTRFTIDMAYADIDTVFIIDDPSNVYDAHKDFYLDRWMSSHESNRINTNDTMELASPRPFGRWYTHVFGMKGKQFSGITYYGILAVSRKDIQGRKVSFYKNLITHVEGHNNPEAGHYIERSWSAIFQISDDRKLAF